MFPFEKEGDIAIPSGDLATNTALFDYLMRFQDDWGLEVYEQDWLTGQFERMNITKWAGALICSLEPQIRSPCSPSPPTTGRT